MQQVTVGTKYQIVIPKEVRRKITGLRPGSKVSIKKVNEETLEVKVSKKNWVDENYGVFKKYLKGAAEEVDKMRDEWEERLKEFEKSR